MSTERCGECGELRGLRGKRIVEVYVRGLRVETDVTCSSEFHRERFASGECWDCGCETTIKFKGEWWCTPCRRRHYE